MSMRDVEKYLQQLREEGHEEGRDEGFAEAVLEAHRARFNAPPCRHTEARRAASFAGQKGSSSQGIGASRGGLVAPLPASGGQFTDSNL